DTVIFDEAHLLEEVATLYFGLTVSAHQLEELARDIEKGAARAGGAAKGGGGAAELRAASKDFFLPIRERLEEGTGRQRFEPAERGGPEVEVEWSVLARALDEAAKPGARAGEGREAIEQRAAELKEALETVLRRDARGFVYGMEGRGRGNVI